VEEALEREYARILPIAKAGLKGLLGRDVVSEREPELTLPDPSAQAEPPQSQIHARTVGSGSTPTTLLSRCKSFVQRLFS